MNAKKAATTILIAILTLMTISAIMPMHANAAGVNSSYITFPDEYMSNTAEWGITYYEGGSPTISISDISGPGVEFDINNVGAKIEVGDNYPVAIPVVGPDLTGFGGYELYLKNVGSAGVNAHLYMNTGYTGGGLAYDTFWGGPWIWLNPGETKLYTLNFSYAEAWNIADDPVYTGLTNGNSYPIFRLNEVTNIGFEVLGSGTLNLVAFGSLNPKLYVTPATVSKSPGDVGGTFAVDIVIENFTDFYGFDINMTWDSSLLNFASATYTTQLNSLWGSGNWNPVLETHPAGSYKLVATKLGTGGNSSTNAYVLFSLTLQIVKASNFPLQTPIHFSLVKLSDSATPVPNPIVPASVTDGMYQMSGTKPDIEMVYDGPTYLEYCKTFEIRVYATHCTNLKDYDLVFSYDTELLKFIDVHIWGLLGDNVTGFAHYEESAPGTVHVWDTDTAPPVTGESIFLFALTFHVEFDGRIEHIWRQHSGQPAYDHMSAQISLTSAQLSFVEGTVGTEGIKMPGPITQIVYFIRGDVRPDGKVNMNDISDAAFYYEKATPATYDLNTDGIIDVYDIVMIATNFGYGM